MFVSYNPVHNTLTSESPHPTTTGLPRVVIPNRNRDVQVVLTRVQVAGVATMHLLLSTLFLGAACIGIQADATQIPLQYNSHISWDFFEKPSRDSTSHLIFDTVNSFLQHWTNTRYRNGQTIVGLILLI